jgi:L-iditol 2-dehydrogenase
VTAVADHGAAAAAAQGRALVVGGPGQVSLEARDPAGHPPVGYLRVSPDLVGLCGTDLEIIDGAIDPAYIRYPVALGHEWTGIVTGDSPLAGRRVVVEGVIGCGHCERCVAGLTNLCESYDEIGFTRDGAAASVIDVPAALVHPLGASVTAGDAVLAEPSAVVYRALTRAAIRPGCRILVIGDGTIALLTVLLARLWSPAEVAMLGRRSEQAALAEVAGATSFDVTSPGATSVGATSAGTRSAGAGFDVVIEAAGSTQAGETALATVRRGGTVVLVGLPPHGETIALPADDAVNNDLTILGSFSYTGAAWRAVANLLNTGMLHPSALITHRFPLTGWQQAIAALRGAGASGPRGKVVLEIS